MESSAIYLLLPRLESFNIPTKGLLAGETRVGKSQHLLRSAPASFIKVHTLPQELMDLVPYPSCTLNLQTRHRYANGLAGNQRGLISNLSDVLPNKADSVGHIQIRRGKSAGLERTVDWAVSRSALNIACEKLSLGSGFGGRGTGNDCKILHCMVLFLTAACTERADHKYIQWTHNSTDITRGGVVSLRLDKGRRRKI